MTDPADPLDNFPAFAAAVRQRLDAGRVAYGDRSFQRPPAELLAELQQEALDLAGWGFVLFERLQRLQAAGAVSSASQVQTVCTSCSTRPTVAAAEPPEPYVASYHGIAVTAAQQAELEAHAAAHGPITAADVWAVVSRVDVAG